MGNKDISITADEYFKILRRTWEESDYFTGWDKKWHPEDLYVNMDTVFNSVGNGIVAYCHLINERDRAIKNFSPAYASNSPVTPQYNQNPFGDNT
jgi:hypothetical protein